MNDRLNKLYPDVSIFDRILVIDILNDFLTELLPMKKHRYRINKILDKCAPIDRYKKFNKEEMVQLLSEFQYGAMMGTGALKK